MARIDVEAAAAGERPSRLPTAAEARAYLESLPDLWAKTSRGESGGKRHCPATTDHLVMRLAEPPEPCDWLRRPPGRWVALRGCPSRRRSTRSE